MQQSPLPPQAPAAPHDDWLSAGSTGAAGSAPVGVRSERAGGGPANPQEAVAAPPPRPS